MTTLSTSRGRSALAVSAVFTSLATLLVLTRIYTRAILVKQMGADDYAILISLTFAWALFGLLAGEVYHGMGEHLELIPPAILKAQMICFWASVPIYQTSLFCTKMSILLQYRRVFSKTSRMQLACSILIGFLAVYGTWTVASAWVNCVPIAKFWDPSLPGFCFDNKALWFSNAGIHIFTDLLILIYPMPVLNSLQLPRRQKFALMGVFALGGFVMLTSILRLRSLLIISNSTDPTYDNVGAAAWSGVECNVAIICASLPSVRAFLSRFVPRVFSTVSNGYRSKISLPSRTGRSVLTSTTTHIQASVIGGRGHERDYDLEDISPPGSSQPSYIKDKEYESESDKEFAGIKVTTFVVQESTPSPLATPFPPHENGSTNEIVRKESF